MLLSSLKKSCQGVSTFAFKTFLLKTKTQNLYKDLPLLEKKSLHRDATLSMKEEVFLSTFIGKNKQGKESLGLESRERTQYSVNKTFSVVLRAACHFISNWVTTNRTDLIPKC